MGPFPTTTISLGGTPVLSPARTNSGMSLQAEAMPVKASRMVVPEASAGKYTNFDGFASDQQLYPIDVAIHRVQSSLLDGPTNVSKFGGTGRGSR